MYVFAMELAGFVFQVESIFETTSLYCRDYWTVREPEFCVSVCIEDLRREQELLNYEADMEGLRRRKFSNMFLERSFIQRRIGEILLEKDVLLMHGSTVALDGQAYLFTAPCGTGKSTHTRFWREFFGDRAVMVNDDKPFLRFAEESIIACGSPWTGKHGLGSNIACPLKGICILRRGTENKIRRIEPTMVRSFLVQQCFMPEVRPERVLVLLDRLLDCTPVWEMECTKDPQAAFVAWQAMSNIDE